MVEFRRDKIAQALARLKNLPEKAEAEADADAEGEADSKPQVPVPDEGD